LSQQFLSCVVHVTKNIPDLQKKMSGSTRDYDDVVVVEKKDYSDSPVDERIKDRKELFKLGNFVQLIDDDGEFTYVIMFCNALIQIEMIYKICLLKQN
jgi:hypothetical protein